jgi:hypothetical protein
VGCDGCAKACPKGGTAQVVEIEGQLKQRGKEIVFDVTPERTCYPNKSRDAFAHHGEDLKKATPCAFLAVVVW